MNVASLELCKELYQMSGWDGTLVKHVVGERHASQFESSFGVTTVYEKTVGVYGLSVGCDECEGDYATDTIPAYGLGYLLRKLQVIAPTLAWMHDEQLWAVITDASFECQYADSPEGAAAKLCINLFKQGILTKGGQAE